VVQAVPLAIPAADLYRGPRFHPLQPLPGDLGSAAMKRQLTDMLTHYRAQNLLNPVMAAIQAEFQAMPEADQCELLFWMVIDVAKNPTKVAPNVPAGTA
jgi:hypothetical protein